MFRPLSLVVFSSVLPCENILNIGFHPDQKYQKHIKGISLITCCQCTSHFRTRQPSSILPIPNNLAMNSHQSSLELMPARSIRYGLIAAFCFVSGMISYCHAISIFVIQSIVPPGCRWRLYVTGRVLIKILQQWWAFGKLKINRKHLYLLITPSAKYCQEESSIFLTL